VRRTCEVDAEPITPGRRSHDWIGQAKFALAGFLPEVTFGLGIRVPENLAAFLTWDRPESLNGAELSALTSRWIRRSR
jgi:hypothetical protein